MEGGSLGEKKAKCSCRNVPFPRRASSSSSTWEVLLTKCESPLCRGSSGWKGNALDCNKSSTASEEPWRPSGCSVCESLRFPFHSCLLSTVQLWKLLKAMDGWNTCILVNWVEQKFLKSSGWPGLTALWGYSAQWLEQEAGSGCPGSSTPPSHVQVMQWSRRNRNTENFSGLFNMFMMLPIY